MNQKNSIKHIYSQEEIDKILLRFKNNRTFICAFFLGHSRIETTENYYISSSDKHKKEANDILEQIIQSNVIDKIIKCKF